MLYLGKNAVVPAITVSGGEVTSVITATNETSSDILEGDKVWINQEDGENKLINLYNNTPNYKVNGTLTFNSGGKVVSGFTTSSELQLSNRKAYSTGEISSMEMLFKIHTPTEGNWTSNGRIINSRKTYMWDDFALDISQTSATLCFINADSPISKLVHVAPVNMASNTDYWIKVTYDGINLYGYYSLDGENYTLQDTLEHPSNELYLDSSYGYSIGNRHMYDGNSNPICVWNGSIDLSESYIKVNGEIWWQPYETNITSDTQTGIAAENIASGSTGLVNVGAVIEPTGSITITTNGTYDVTDYAEAVVNVPVPVVDKYKVGDRVNDDSGNPVGTVSSIFTDGNGDRYAVVCLDAVNRLASGQWLSSLTTVSGIPQYSSQLVWSAPETATTNTSAILATGTSSACSHCRSKSFVIDGITYEGQFPNLLELSQILNQRAIINTQDPTASTYSSLIIPSNTAVWSSSQYDSTNGWDIYSNGAVYGGPKNESIFVIPVLEIPLED